MSDAVRINGEAAQIEAETRKLRAESDKLTAETIKFYAEAAKLRRDRWWVPVFGLSAFASAFFGLGIVAGAGLIKLFQ